MKKYIHLGFALCLGMTQAMAQGSWGTHIGTTTYDLQSNAASPNRIVRDANGNIMATYTRGTATGSSPTWPERGTGFVTSADNGDTWSAIPTARIENVRVGWGEPVFTSNGVKVFSHSADNIGSVSRSAFNSGTWSAFDSLYNNSSNGTWPRIAQTDNALHLIFSANDSTHILFNDPNIESDNDTLYSPCWYKRSTDNGATWSPKKVVDGMHDISRIGGDSYAIDAKGTTVAMTMGEGDDPWMLFKSTDEGVTWNNTTILNWKVDGRILGTSTDVFAVLAPTSEQTVLIDNTGKVHAWVSAYSTGTVDNSTIDGANTQGTSYFPGSADWMLYWNESLSEPIVITGLQPDIDNSGDLKIADVTYNDLQTHGANVGTARQIYDVSNVHSACSSIDATGNLYVTYFAAVEGVDDGSGTITYPTSTGDEAGRSFTDLYTIVSTDGGATWSNPLFLANLAGISDDSTKGTSFEEETYPSAIKRIGSDDIYHLTFQTDFETGINLQGFGAAGDNFIMYHGFPTADLLTAATAAGTTLSATISDSTTLGMGALPSSLLVGLKDSKIENIKNTSKSYPNPTKGIVNVNVQTTTNTEATLVVRNIFGQEVKNVSAIKLNSGNSTIQFNVEDLSTGVYNYTIVTNENIYSGKIVKE